MNKSNNIGSEIRVPWYSNPSHRIMPKLYVQPWTQDMVNREIIVKNAKDLNVPNYEHDDALYLNNREQMKYNVQNRDEVDRVLLGKMPTREQMMKPNFHDVEQKYRSGNLARYNDYDARELEGLKPQMIPPF